MNDQASQGIPYFLDGTLPPPGIVCQQDLQPFTTSPSG